MTHITIALLVAQPGPLRNSLQAVLNALPEIEVVAEARDVAIINQASDGLQPDIILIEVEGADEPVTTAVQQVKRSWPSARCILLVETAQQQQAAEIAGSDVVLFKGCRAPQLVNHIEVLLAAMKNPDVQSNQETRRVKDEMANDEHKSADKTTVHGRFPTKYVRKKHSL